MWAQSIAKAATSCGSLVVSNRSLRASKKQHVILACTRVPAKKPRIKIASGWHQTTSEQDQIIFTNSISEGKLQQILLR